MIYNIFNATFLYRDQYGKLVFQIPTQNAILDQLNEKIMRYDSLNPIYSKGDGSDYIVKFNDYTYNFKSRVLYDITFFITKNFSNKVQKTYINLHINTMKQHDRKELPKIRLEEI